MPKALAIFLQKWILPAEPTGPGRGEGAPAVVAEVVMRPQVADRFEVHEGRGLGLGANDHIINEGAFVGDIPSHSVFLEAELERRAINPGVEGDPTSRRRNGGH